MVHVLDLSWFSRITDIFGSDSVEQFFAEPLEAIADDGLLGLNQTFRIKDARIHLDLCNCPVEIEY